MRGMLRRQCGRFQAVRMTTSACQMPEMRMRTLVAALILMPVLGSVPALCAEDQQLAADQLLAKLAQAIPESPTLVGLSTDRIPNVTFLIDEAGATRRLDAAELLIKALAFNFDPSSSNEHRSDLELIPAASALKVNYGAKVLPLLIFEGSRQHPNGSRFESLLLFAP